MNFCETTTSEANSLLVRAIQNRKPTDPEVLSILQEIFGKEDNVISHRSKRSLTTSENVMDVPTSGSPKTSSLIKGGNLPLVDFKGMGNDTKEPMDQHNEMCSCLRLVRQTQSKLKYLWNKIHSQKPSGGNDIVVVGMEKRISKNSNNLEVPLTLQIGEPSVKS